MPPFRDELEEFRAVQAALDGPYGDNATLYARTAALMKAANFPDPKAFATTTLSRFIDRCNQLGIVHPHVQIAIQMAGTAAGVYAAERFESLPPNPALYGTHGDNAALGEM